MGRVEKIYVTVLPMTTEEYAVGQQHAVVSMTASETTGDFKVELLENTTTMHETLGKVNKTHKLMHLKSKIPSMLHSLIPEDACLVEEMSYNAYDRCHTTYKNRYFSADTFNMSFNTVNLNGHEVLANPFGYDSSHADGIEHIHLHLHENVANPAFNPAEYYHEESGRGQLHADWIEDYRRRDIPLMVCYKHLSVEVNKFAMGWVPGKIEAAMRGVVASVQQRIFCTMHEWYGKRIEDMGK